MAVMSAAQRIATGAEFQADASRDRDQFGAVTKADIQAAIAAVDDWVVNNQTNFNGALPLAARTALTATQKARVLLYVVRRRFDLGV